MRGNYANDPSSGGLDPTPIRHLSREEYENMREQRWDIAQETGKVAIHLFAFRFKDPDVEGLEYGIGNLQKINTRIRSTDGYSQINGLYVPPDETPYRQPFRTMSGHSVDGLILDEDEGNYELGYFIDEIITTDVDKFLQQHLPHLV